MKIVIFFVIFNLILIACSKKQEKIGRDQMIKMTMATDPNAELVIAGLGNGPKCTDYGPGCVGAHTVALKRLEMIVVEYDSKESAEKDAIRLKGYYKDNWLFDDVAGEPILEKFVAEAYQAINPSKSK